MATPQNNKQESLAARLVRGEERNLTNTDVARIICQSPATVRWNSTAHPDRLPPSFKVGKITLYPESGVIRWLEQHMPDSLNPPKAASARRGRPRKATADAPSRVGGAA